MILWKVEFEYDDEDMLPIEYRTALYIDKRVAECVADNLRSSLFKTIPGFRVTVSKFNV